MNSAQNLKALIVGSTGAVGQELVNLLAASTNWSEIHVVVRKEHESWKNLPQEQRQKLKVFQLDNLDLLQDTSKFTNFQGVNSVFCCLGSQTKHGKELFVKVDKLYPNYIADIAQKNNIPQYHLVSSQMADKNSMFLYTKTKGETEYLLEQKNFNYLGIYRPGLILNRSGERLVEKIFSYVPFISKIEVRDIAVAMKHQAEQKALSIQQNTHKNEIFENRDILKLAKQ